MNGRIFVDTNVLVYTISTEEPKRDKAREAVDAATEVVLSAQVLSEFVNVCLRKELLAPHLIEGVLEGFLDAYEVVPVHGHNIRQALSIQRRYHYSWWDSVLLASALEANCSALHTEDLQHGQTIEGRLLIRNPFL